MNVEDLRKLLDLAEPNSLIKLAVNDNVCVLKYATVVNGTLYINIPKAEQMEWSQSVNCNIDKR